VLPPSTFGRGARGLLPQSEKRKSCSSYYSGSIDSRGAKRKKYKRSKKQCSSGSSEKGPCNIKLNLSMNNSKIIQFERDGQHEEPFVDDDDDELAEPYFEDEMLA
jgi:hypothetical protein